MLINFDLDSANLTPQAQENLDEFAKALNERPAVAARVSSSRAIPTRRGSEQYNLGLSERRAEAVTKFLLDKGVSRKKR